MIHGTLQQGRQARIGANTGMNKYMNIMDILTDLKPGDALRANRSVWPVYLNLGEELSAGPAPFHSGSVLDHLCRCMNETAGDPLAVWMAMTHDAGKLTTPLGMLPHHYGHELRGEKMAGIWAAQLGLGREYVAAGKICARHHMRAGRYLGMRPGKQYKLLSLINGRPEAASFWKVIDADTKSSISALASRDWELVERARDRGLSEEMQIAELCKYGLGARIRKRARSPDAF